VILFDTHVLLWYTKGLAELGASARALADEALSQDRLAVSAITFWEVEMGDKKNKKDFIAAPLLSQPQRTPPTHSSLPALCGHLL
jgi:PIN domain nuclease of toxin-antitoxin system